MCSWSQPPHEPLSLPTSQAIIHDMKRRAASLAQPFRAVIEAIDLDDPHGQKGAWANHLPYWPTQGWPDHPARGKVTLAGDAAHPMTPHRGQGLNNAILDCRDLVKEIFLAREEPRGGKRLDGQQQQALQDAVKRYEVSMWERGHEAVLSNLENSIAVHDWDLLMKSPIMRAGVVQKVARMEQQQQQQRAAEEAKQTNSGEKADRVG